MTSPVFQNLVAAALVGTETQEPRIAAGPASLQALLAEGQDLPREARLLRAASALDLWCRAGQESLAAEGPAFVEPANDLPLPSHEAGRLMTRMLAGECSDLLPEALRRLARAGHRVPDDLLPYLLDLGSADRAFRASLGPALGATGRWLAAQNPTWSYAASTAEDESAWETGSLPSRIQWLTDLRRRDPGQGREMLQGVWRGEPASTRQELIACLATGLSSVDESFLESALDDKSKEVGRRAARLLALLPESQYAERMRQRGRAAVQFQPAKLFGSGKLNVQPPAELDAASKRDGIDTEPPSGLPTMGKQGAMLYHVVAALPPSFWTAEWKVTPDALLKMAAKTDWPAALVNGWADAAVHQADPFWVDALFDHKVVERPAVIAGLAGIMPLEKLEERCREALEREKDYWESSRGAAALLSLVPVPWRPGLALAFLDALRRRMTAGQTWHYRWRDELRRFALAVPLELSDAVRNGWPERSAAFDSWQAELDTHLFSVLDFRLQLVKAIATQETTPSP